MRNLLKHPITNDEIIKMLEEYAKEVDPAKTGLIGDMRPLLAQEAIKKLKQAYDDDKTMQLIREAAELIKTRPNQDAINTKLAAILASARRHIASFEPGTLVGSELNLACCLRGLDGDKWQPWTVPGEYEDEVTPKQIEALNKIVSDDEFKDYKTISGPAWGKPK